MTTKLNRQLPSNPESRPSFPLQQQPGSLFLGWGPKL